MLIALEVWSYLQSVVVWWLFKKLAKRNVLGDLLAGMLIGFFLEFATEPLWTYHFHFTYYRDTPPGVVIGWGVMFTVVTFLSEKLYTWALKKPAIVPQDKRIFLFDLLAGVLIGMPFEVIGFKTGVWNYNQSILNWSWGQIPVIKMPLELLASYTLLMLVAPTFVRYWQGSFEKN